MKYMLIYALISIYSGGESVRGGERGPYELDECQTRKAEMEKLQYPYLGLNEKLIVTCEPAKEAL